MIQQILLSECLSDLTQPNIVHSVYDGNIPKLTATNKKHHTRTKIIPKNSDIPIFDTGCITCNCMYMNVSDPYGDVLNFTH